MSKAIAVTVCRNEEKLIRNCVRSVVNQTFPVFYVVVDDASTDSTTGIIREFENITLLRIKESGAKDAGARIFTAFMEGVRIAEKHVSGWHYLLKVDADSVLPSTYLQSMIEKIGESPKVGIASGTPLTRTRSSYVKMRMDKSHASDGARVYRRECWDEIGGLYPMYGSDTYALLEARHLGWRTTNFPIYYKEQRPWGQETISWWITIGETRYRLGYPLRHHALMCMLKLKNKPFFVGALACLQSYLLNCFLPWRRPFDRSYYQFVKVHILDEMISKIANYRQRLKGWK